MPFEKLQSLYNLVTEEEMKQFATEELVYKEMIKTTYCDNMNG